MLSLIEVMIGQLNYNYMRMDGSTPISQREGLVRSFNGSSSEEVFVMLLTTRTGGVGISLVGANKVVLVDPGGC
jgi:DNA excision repair protein ERCC-6